MFLNDYFFLDKNLLLFTTIFAISSADPVHTSAKFYPVIGIKVLRVPHQTSAVGLRDTDPDTLNIVFFISPQTGVTGMVYFVAVCIVLLPFFSFCAKW